MAEREVIRGDHRLADVEVQLHLVVRRLRLTAREIDKACREQRLPTREGEACCELVVNGSVVADGSIERIGEGFAFKRGGAR